MKTLMAQMIIISKHALRSVLIVYICIYLSSLSVHAETLEYAEIEHETCESAEEDLHRYIQLTDDLFDFRQAEEKHLKYSFLYPHSYVSKYLIDIVLPPPKSNFTINF